MTHLNLNSVYSNYYRKARLFALSYVHDEWVAEDIVSEAIVNLWELSKKKEIINIEVILITAIRSKALNHLKHLQVRERTFDDIRKKEARELEIRISTLEACEPQEILSKELRTKVKSLLANMPEQTRKIFIMGPIEGRAHKEIAEEVGISVKGVEYHITKAMKILRINLKEYAPLFLLLLKANQMSLLFPEEVLL